MSDVSMYDLKCEYGIYSQEELFERLNELMSLKSAVDEAHDIYRKSLATRENGNVAAHRMVDMVAFALSKYQEPNSPPKPT